MGVCEGLCKVLGMEVGLLVSGGGFGGFVGDWWSVGCVWGLGWGGCVVGFVYLGMVVGGKLCVGLWVFGSNLCGFLVFLGLVGVDMCGCC